jgi:hypothetical protein
MGWPFLDARVLYVRFDNGGQDELYFRAMLRHTWDVPRSINLMSPSTVGVRFDLFLVLQSFFCLM